MLLYFDHCMCHSMWIIVVAIAAILFVGIALNSRSLGTANGMKKARTAIAEAAQLELREAQQKEIARLKKRIEEMDATRQNGRTPFITEDRRRHGRNVLGSEISE